MFAAVLPTAYNFNRSLDASKGGQTTPRIKKAHSPSFIAYRAFFTPELRAIVQRLAMHGQAFAWPVPSCRLVVSQASPAAILQTTRTRRFRFDKKEPAIMAPIPAIDWSAAHGR